MTPTSDALQRIPDSDKDRPFQLRANKIFRSQKVKSLHIKFFFFFFLEDMAFQQFLSCQQIAQTIRLMLKQSFLFLSPVSGDFIRSVLFTGQSPFPAKAPRQICIDVYKYIAMFDYIDQFFTLYILFYCVYVSCSLTLKHTYTTMTT